MFCLNVLTLVVIPFSQQRFDSCLALIFARIMFVKYMSHRKTKFVQDACDTFSRRSFSRRLSRRFSKIPGVLKERLERYLEERLENVYLERPLFKTLIQDVISRRLFKIPFKTGFQYVNVS